MPSRWERKFKAYLPLFVLCIAFSAVLYSLLMIHQLVNQADGLWWCTYHHAGDWERSIGRWLWPYIDNLHSGINIDPLSSMVSLGFFVLGCILVVDVFEIQSHLRSFLICGLFLSSIAVCASLSYRFMSVIFALAFLFSIAAAWVLIRGKRGVPSILAGAAAITVSMGLYQMYLGCTCIVILGWMMRALLREEMPLRSIGKLVARSALSLCLGGLLYLIIMKLHLKVYHVSASYYKGADAFSIARVIRELPHSIAHCYGEFFSFIRGTNLRFNAIKGQRFFVAAYFILGGGSCYFLNKGLENRAVQSHSVSAAPAASAHCVQRCAAVCH